MYLLYLDDSGSAGNKNEEHLVLAEVSVFERRTYHLAKELDDLTATYDQNDPDSVEFHASEIWRGKSGPWAQLDRPTRQQALKNVLGVLARDDWGTYAFAVVVHKKSFPNDDPMEIAFEEICRRFDLQLSMMNKDVNWKEQNRGMLIFDESAYETTLQRLAKDFRQFGTKWGVLKNLAEVPLFVDSRASRIIQLADHVAYSVFRAYEAADFNYLNVVLKKFHSDGSTGKLHGLVHKQTHDLNCMCQACLSRRLA